MGASSTRGGGGGGGHIHRTGTRHALLDYRHPSRNQILVLVACMHFSGPDACLTRLAANYLVAWWPRGLAATDVAFFLFFFGRRVAIGLPAKERTRRYCKHLPLSDQARAQNVPLPRMVVTSWYIWTRTSISFLPHLTLLFPFLSFQCAYAERESINVSLTNLLTFPWVKERVNRRELQLHGMLYDLKDGEPMGRPPPPKKKKHSSGGYRCALFRRSIVAFWLERR